MEEENFCLTFQDLWKLFKRLRKGGIACDVIFNVPYDIPETLIIHFFLQDIEEGSKRKASIQHRNQLLCKHDQVSELYLVFRCTLV